MTLTKASRDRYRPVRSPLDAPRGGASGPKIMEGQEIMSMLDSVRFASSLALVEAANVAANCNKEPDSSSVLARVRLAVKMVEQQLIQDLVDTLELRRPSVRRPRTTSR